MAGESILFADDDEMIRKLAQTFLTRRGYRVRTVVDGAEALRAVAEEMPHLLITDVNMPFINGFELTRRLREDRRTSRLPILMLSARKQADDVLAGYNEGADDYVPKPIEMAILAAKIESLLKRVAASSAVEPHIGKVVTFMHAKGGVGATTLAVNTAIALNSTSSYQAGLLDLGLQFGNAGMLLDIRTNRTIAGLATMTLAETDDASFDEFVMRHSSGVRVITAPELPEESELVTVPVVQQVIERLRARVDYLVIDTPALLSEAILAAVDASDLICVVTAPQVVAVKATHDLLNVLAKVDVADDRILTILDRIRQRGIANELVEKTLGRKLGAVIPYSDLFDEAADTGRPVFSTHQDNVAAESVRQLAALLPSRAPLDRSAAPPA